jgi:hypothetical protein
MLYEHLHHFMGTVANQTENGTRITFSQHDFVLLLIDCYCTPLCILEETGTSNAITRNCTPRCHFCAMQRTLAKFMRVVWSPVVTVLFIHKTSNVFAMSQLLLISIIRDNAHRCPEFIGRYHPLSDGRKLTAELNCADFAIWRVLPAPHCQVYESNVNILAVLLSFFLSSLLTPFRYPQQEIIAARSIASLKLRSETSFSDRNALCFDMQLHCRNAVLH